MSELMQSIGISRQQALTLLEDNNKYLAHVLVKGVRGSFQEIEQLMERWFRISAKDLSKSITGSWTQERK